jgi:tRNA-Thr(GGU) m(6)t(6)A37 methyltransferase TsaA
MTSNSLRTVNAALTALASGSRQDRGAAASLSGGLAAFVLGAFTGALLTRELGTQASWAVAALFLLSGVMWLTGASNPLHRNGSGSPKTRTGGQDVAVSSGAYQVHPIGWVRSSLVDLSAAPKQSDEGAPEAELVFGAEFVEGLKDLHAGETIWVLTWLDRAARDVLVVHPRDDVTRPQQGVFSTRSADRPNPIGLHRVEISSIDGSTVRVCHLEAIDGTPIIDVKPTLGPARDR